MRHSTAHIRLLALLACTLTLIAPLLAHPTPQPQPWEKASLEAGAYFPTFDSQLSFNIGRVNSNPINGEDQLSLPKQITTFYTSLLYRPDPKRRHQLDFAYSSYRRNATTQLTDPIDLGDNLTIPAVQIESTLNFDIIRPAYSYAWLQNNHARISTGLAAHILPVEYGLTYASGNTPTELQPQTITLPIPTLALRANFRLWNQLYLTTQANGVYLDIAGFRGTLLDARAALEYRLLKNLALGAAYSGMIVDILSTNNDPAYPGATSIGHVDVSFHGAHAFIKLLL